MTAKKPKRKKPVKRAEPMKRRPAAARKSPRGAVGYVRKSCPGCKTSYCVPISQTICPKGHTFPITDWSAC
jgi:hypothetical protein